MAGDSLRTVCHRASHRWALGLQCQPRGRWSRPQCTYPCWLTPGWALTHSGWAFPSTTGDTCRGLLLAREARADLGVPGPASQSLAWLPWGPWSLRVRSTGPGICLGLLRSSLSPPSSRKPRCPSHADLSHLLDLACLLGCEQLRKLVTQFSVAAACPVAGPLQGPPGLVPTGVPWAGVPSLGFSSWAQGPKTPGTPGGHGALRTSAWGLANQGRSCTCLGVSTPTSASRLAMWLPRPWPHFPSLLRLSFRLAPPPPQPPAQ